MTCIHYSSERLDRIERVEKYERLLDEAVASHDPEKLLQTRKHRPPQGVSACVTITPIQPPLPHATMNLYFREMQVRAEQVRK